MIWLMRVGGSIILFLKKIKSNMTKKIFRRLRRLYKLLEFTAFMLMTSNESEVNWTRIIRFIGNMIDLRNGADLVQICRSSWIHGIAADHNSNNVTFTRGINKGVFVLFK